MITIHEIEEELLVADAQDFQNEIVLYNDDVNTFDHVINTLIKVCKHTSEQAEQCALLVHYHGKCTVKTGQLEELKQQCSQLLSVGLSAKLV